MSRGNSRSHANSWIGYCRLSRTMITGYKREKLGRPSDKLSGDVPRAGWRAVIVSEVIFPIVMAVVFVAAYMFVKSFPDQFNNQPPSPLIRIAVISLGPIVWNAAILLVLFILSLSIGPILEPRYPSFGSIIAAVAHIFAIVGMVGSFELLVRVSVQFSQSAIDAPIGSGSLSSGRLHMPFLASSLSLRYNAPSTRS
jgi:1,3-beta-glucan synthase